MRMRRRFAERQLQPACRLPFFHDRRILIDHGSDEKHYFFKSAAAN
jgi:hypothetical protein